MLLHWIVLLPNRVKLLYSYPPICMSGFKCCSRTTRHWGILVQFPKNHPGKPMDFLKSQLSNLSYENLRVITIPETNLFAPENGWLEDKPFLLGYHLVRCYLSFRECTPQCHVSLGNRRPYHQTGRALHRTARQGTVHVVITLSAATRLRKTQTLVVLG